ncbi:MAG: hypothetical protein HC915_19515 [Anaerolineae bacterium]|nr:hypothetical protein [Anaerolineae bacterium]
MISLATDHGWRLEQVLSANSVPTLVTQQPLRMAPGTHATITADLLLADDTNDPPAQLLFSVVTAPQQGTLDPTEAFTQAALESETVIYTHTGTEGDSFSFLLSDGKDHVGPFLFQIEIDQPPTLAQNMGWRCPWAARQRSTRRN